MNKEVPTFDSEVDENAEFMDSLDQGELDFGTTRESLDFITDSLKIEEGVPKDVVAVRNEYFEETTNQIKEATSSFSEKLKAIKKKAVKSLIIKLFPSFVELFFLVRMLFQEAKEIDSFKDWLTHKLLMSLMELESLKEELDNYKEQSNVHKDVKDILMNRNKGLERQLHLLSDKNIALNEAIRVRDLHFQAYFEAWTESNLARNTRNTARIFTISS
jgi:FtsZ-binding cell division protein ZapB